MKLGGKSKGFGIGGPKPVKQSGLKIKLETKKFRRSL